MLWLDLDIKILELVLVLGGMRNGHNVEVESKDVHTVTNKKTNHDQRDSPEGGEREPGGGRKISPLLAASEAFRPEQNLSDCSEI